MMSSPIPTPDFIVRSHGITDIGLQRASNQDHFLIAPLHHPLAFFQSSTPLGETWNSQPPGTFLAVADGMGGHAHGEVASRVAIECVYAHISSLWHEFLSIANTQESDRAILDQVKACFMRAERKMASMVDKEPDFDGMGTTLTIAFVRWPKLYVGHVGDSRCYLLRETRLEKLTTDQTLATLYESGNSPEIAEEIAEDSPSLENVLYNCLGGAVRTMEVECQQLDLLPGDTVLLCSDGLTKHVEEEQVSKIVGDANSLVNACHLLVNAAKNKGGSDNITVAITEILSTGHDSKAHRSSVACDQFADTAKYAPADEQTLDFDLSNLSSK